MKNFFSRMLLIMVVLGVLFTVSDTYAKKWRMSVGYPRGVAIADLYQEFPDVVKQMTKGELSIDVVYGGEGVDQTEIFRAVKSGLVEMGFPYMALFAGELPAGMVQLGLPGGPSDYVELQALFHLEWKKKLREIYAKHNLYLLGQEYQLPTYVLTKKRITSIDDFKGLKIRAPGAYGKHFRNLGATPVVMAYAEVYTGLATKVIDGVDAMNIIDHLGGKFHEISKYMYPLPITGTQVFPLVVNLKAWNSLSDDHKAILEQAANWHAEFMAINTRVEERKALNQMRKQGLQMSPQPSEEDVKKWREAGQKVWQEYMTDPDSKELLRIQDEFMTKLGY